MSNIYPTYHNRVRFFIDNKTVGRKLIEEPLGWNEDQKEYARHKRHGIFPSISNSLYFFGKSQELLDVIWDVEGVKANILIIKEERHPITSKWARSYWGFLDMLTREVEDGIVSFKFNSGGVEKLRKSRESKKVEIESLETIDGEILEPLQTHQLLLDGREIFLKTNYDIEDSNNNAYLYNDTVDNTRGSTVCVPLHITSKSHERAQSPLPNTLVGDNSHDRSANGTNGLMFFANNDVERILKIKFNISFTVRVRNYDDLNWSKFWLRLATYQDGVSYNYKEAINLWLVYESDHAILSYNNQTLSFDFNQEITLLAGESLSLQFCQLMDGENNQSAHLEVDFENILCNLEITEESKKEPTQTKFVFAKELVERLLQMTTKKDVLFYSESLWRTDLGAQQDGIASLKAYAHGMWIRGYDKFPENDENRYKYFTTSLKDVLDDLEVTHNLGLGFERIGYIERYVIEPREYFYQNEVAFRLPYKIQKVKRKVAEDLLYGSIHIGFNEGFENEEAQGLDDYHANSSWNTCLGMVQNVYQKMSKFIASSYAVEFIRRKPKTEYETYDHKNDKKIFIFNLKRYTSTLFKEKKWQDELEQEPAGVFSPNTATKLIWSPLNLFLKHAKFFGAGLYKFAYDFIKLGEANGSKTLKTKPENQPERTEGDSVQNLEISRAILKPEIIEFEHEITFFINEAIQGYTEINGRKVPNLYLMWEFINENRKIERGYINNVKLNDGKWELIIANR